MAETRSRSIRIADDVWEAIQALPGKTDDALRAILVTGAVPKVDSHAEVGRWFRETWAQLDEILETVQSESFIPTVGAAYVMPSPVDPATIPGVHKGLPPRESGAERAARERRERQERARNSDSTDDESFDRSDEYVSG